MAKFNIKQSVGVGGKNKPIDVAIIQSLLNEYINSLNKPGKLPIIKLSKLIVDGGVCKVAPNPLNEAIKAFQKDIAKLKKIDGRIDPGGTTFKKLVKYSKSKSSALRNVIFGDSIKHTSILSSVNIAIFRAYFLQYYGLVRAKEDLNGFMRLLTNDVAMTDIRWAAYTVATAYHETAYTFKPVSEYGKGKGRKYAKIIKVTDTNGLRGAKNTVYDNVYYGRGYVQITWEDSYKGIGGKIGMGNQLHVNPDKALDMKTAYKILSFWMLNPVPKVKSTSLKNYINASQTDYYNARRIVNILNEAHKIAAYAENIELIMRLSAR